MTHSQHVCVGVTIVGTGDAQCGVTLLLFVISSFVHSLSTHVQNNDAQLLSARKTYENLTAQQRDVVTQDLNTRVEALEARQPMPSKIPYWGLPDISSFASSAGSKRSISIVGSDLYQQTGEGVKRRRLVRATLVCREGPIWDYDIPIVEQGTSLIPKQNFMKLFEDASDLCVTDVQNDQQWAKPFQMLGLRRGIHSQDTQLPNLAEADEEYKVDNNLFQLNVRSCRLDFVISTHPLVVDQANLGPEAALLATDGKVVYCEVESGDAREMGVYQTVLGVCGLAQRQPAPNIPTYGLYIRHDGHTSLQQACLCRVHNTDTGPEIQLDGIFSMGQVPNLCRSLLGLPQLQT